jgi:hypothetical protein
MMERMHAKPVYLSVVNLTAVSGSSCIASNEVTINE